MDQGRVVALIQARMDSNRLPGKALIPLAGVPAIERVVQNCRLSRHIRETVIATSAETSDDVLAEFAARRGIPCFRGSKNNIVRRYLGAAELYRADTLVRVTGDCPLVSPEIIDHLLELHCADGPGVTVIDTATVPVGTAAEIISFAALRLLAALPLDFSYSEYLTFYFKDNPDRFRVRVAEAPAAYRFPDYRLTLDQEEDRQMFASLFEQLQTEGLTTRLPDVLRVLGRHPEIAALNAGLTLRYRTDDELIRRIHAATTGNHNA